MTTSGEKRQRWKRPLVLALMLAVAAIASPAWAGITDINPNSSTSSDADASSGGRVNGLAAVAGDNQTFYAASEKGGLFKSTDGGNNWARLNNFLPTAAWDVEVDPSNTQIVYATSLYDGRVTSQSGIEVSTNGGTTWTHPASANPPVAYNCPNAFNQGPIGFTPSVSAERNSPSAFGIAIRPDATQNVFIGTNCGLAISNDSGATWRFVDPTPATAASVVYDVVAQAGGTNGIVDICGDDGHLRSTDGGTTWTRSTGLPGGRCSIATSPDESYVLFVAASDNNLYESDNADTTAPTWTNLGTPDIQGPQGRTPFVETNQRSDSGGNNVFDLWYGDVSLYRGSCTTPATPASGGAARCPAGLNPVPNPAPSSPPAGWAGPFTRSVGGHDDLGDIVFDTQAANDACPRLFSSDGGAHRNTDTGSDCQNPNWQRSNAGLHGLWVWSMSGDDVSGVTNEDLYFGNQDDGFFGATDAGAASPTWKNFLCCDTFDILASNTWGVLVNDCCYPSGVLNRINLGGSGYTSPAQINTYPGGNVPGFTWSKRLGAFGSKGVVMLTSSGVFFTNDITASPIVWSALGTGAPGGLCGVQVATSSGTPTFFVQTGQCDGTGGDQVWSHAGATTTGAWTRIDNNVVGSGFGVFGVDPSNPNDMYASVQRLAGPRMYFSTDGGTTWNPDTELDTLMSGNGFYRNTFVYPQPTLVSYDQENGNILVAGGYDSGVFVSYDGGADWSPLTNNQAPTNAKPLLPRPRTTYFDGEPAGTVNIYLGTEGRGVWRIALQQPVASAGGPYTTNEGTNVTLDASASTDPGGQPLTYAWDLDNDGNFNDATGVSPVFDRVGNDGVYTVRVKVTNADGAFAIASTTVTVNNVAPSVTALASNGPKNENSAITVTGTITDPGWLDPLTATIDWGDGGLPQAISGTLENVRPDATLTFSVSHTYGDNGTFTANVCGQDENGATGCRTIALQIDNVNPTATISTAGTVLVNGVPTFIAHAGVPVNFSGNSQDPGSDDLTLSWDWADGAPSPDVTTVYLNNPPNPDPFPSPSINPRNVTDAQTHAFGTACLYQIAFGSRDDDAGTASANANVIITGNDSTRRSAGYWQSQYKAGVPAAMLQCYLDIAGYMSVVFNEVRNAATIPAALAVLSAGSKTTMKEQFDRQLLAVWLNFANGSIDYGTLVDTNRDHVGDTPFSTVVANAEAIRVNSSSTDAQIEAQKDLLERINAGQA